MRKIADNMYFYHIKYILFLWFFVCLFLWPVVFYNKVISPYDILYTIQPWKSELKHISDEQGIYSIHNPQSADALLTSLPLARVAQRQMEHGQLPIWDNNTLTGFPIGAFVSIYPIQLFAFRFLPPDQAIAKLTLFHLLLLSLFGYLVVVAHKSKPLAGVVGGLVATINGLVIFHLIAPAMLSAIAWMLSPFWCFAVFMQQTRMRWTVLAGLCYGFLILSGNIQLVLYASLVYGLYVLVWVIVALLKRDRHSAARYFVHSILMVIIGFLISAPTILLLWQIVSESSRDVGKLSAFTQWHWWIRLLVPHYYGDVVRGDQAPLVSFTSKMYIGIFPLLLASIAVFFSPRLEARIFALVAIALAAVTLLIPPFSTVFYLIVPPTLRLDHSRLLIMSSLLLAVCAGLGMDVLLKDRHYRKFAVLGSAALVTVLACLLIANNANLLSHTNVPNITTRSESIMVSLIIASVILICLILWNSVLDRIIPIVLVLIIAFDLLANFWSYQSTFREGLIQVPPTIARLAEQVHENRVVPARVYQVGITGPMAQLLNYFDIPDIGGYTSLPLNRYNKYTYASGARLGGASYWTLAMAINAYRVPLFDALGAEYIVSDRNSPAPGDTRTDLWPDLPRSVVNQGGTSLVTLSSEMGSQSQQGEVDVPDRGRSYLMTGIVVLNGSVSYTILVNGQPVISETVNAASVSGSQQQIDINLTPQAGRTVDVEFRASAPPNVQWHWISPQINYNPDGSGFLLLDVGGILVYKNHYSFPRAWLVHETIPIMPNNLEAAEIYLKDPSLDLRRVALVENAGVIDLGPASLTDNVTIISYEPTSIHIHVSTSTNAFLVLPDIYQKGWRARIDGQDARVYPTNIAMRGVEVHSGNHTVEFYYETKLLNWSIYLSFTLMIVCAVIFISCTFLAPRKFNDIYPL